MIVAASLLSSFTLSPALVHSSRLGLHPASDSLIVVWQEEGELEYSNGFILSRSWCNHDRTVCQDDELLGCPTDECTHVWTVYSCCPDIYITARAGIPVSFWATDPAGEVQTGTWGGAGDWDLNGRVDSADFFAFLNDYFEEDGDENLDGRCDSTDFFDYLADFFAA